MWSGALLALLLVAARAADADVVLQHEAVAVEAAEATAKPEEVIPPKP
jgi:hypothetical protein